MAMLLSGAAQMVGLVGPGPYHFLPVLKNFITYIKIVIVGFNYLLSRTQRLKMAYKLLLPTREEFPSQTNQPTNIIFPKRMFSQKLHSFQASWFTTTVALVAL